MKQRRLQLLMGDLTSVDKITKQLGGQIDSYTKNRRRCQRRILRPSFRRIHCCFMSLNRTMLLFLLEADCANHFSSGKTLTRLASLLTPLNLAISCHFFIDLQIPPPFVAKNNKSAIQESASVESAVSELLSLECISEVFIPPAVLNPLSVSIQKSGKNACFWIFVMSMSISFKSTFRCEDVSTAGELLNAEGFMFSFDLKSGYHHVENFPGHRQYFSFSWTFSSGHTRYFHFEVFPFGISSAPYLFTKILVKKLRSEGKSIIVSLDDGLGSAAGYIKAKITNLDVHSDLLKSGFILASHANVLRGSSRKIV